MSCLRFRTNLTGFFKPGFLSTLISSRVDASQERSLSVCPLGSTILCDLAFPDSHDSLSCLRALHVQAGSRTMNCLQLRSGAQFPQVGLGTWQGSGEEIKNAAKEALKLGYRLIDSAWAYNNEEVLGEAFKECFDSGVLTRQELFYTTKLAQFAHRREKVKIFLEKSLKKLGFEYVDLFLIHFPVATQHVDDAKLWPVDSEGKVLFDEELDILETWKGMEDCVDAGLAKDIGLSNFNAQQVQYIYDGARIKPANLQVECHIYFQQRPLLDLCKKLGMTLTAYSPLGSPASPAFLTQRFGQDFKLAASVLEEPLLKVLAEKYHKTVAQIALRFLVQIGCVVIPKSVTAARIKENMQIFDFSLDDKDVDAVSALDHGIRLFYFNFVKGITESRKYPW